MTARTYLFERGAEVLITEDRDPDELVSNHGHEPDRAEHGERRRAHIRAVVPGAGGRSVGVCTTIQPHQRRWRGGRWAPDEPAAVPVQALPTARVPRWWTFVTHMTENTYNDGQ